MPLNDFPAPSGAREEGNAMSRPKAIVIVPTGRPVPPIEALSTEADLVVVRTADELRAAQPGAQILFLNDFRSNLLREVGPGELR